jgi:hypothetical protein
MRAPIGHFDHAAPAPDCLDELTRPVADAVRAWHGSVPADQIVYVDTDPEWADTATFVEHYGRSCWSSPRTAWWWPESAAARPCWPPAWSCPPPAST